jgi:homocitrate synthase NifV
LPQLIELASAVSAAGAARLRLADTVGVWGPQQTAAAVAAVRDAVPELALGFHAHNDLGLATANTCAALRAGATSADVTVLGIGERAGNAALEQVVMALRHVEGLELGVRTHRLKELADFVARRTVGRMAPNQPVVGPHAFRHESGIHVHGMLRDRRAYQGFAASEVGATSHMVLGRHAGIGAVRHALACCGFRSAALPRGWATVLRRLAKWQAIRSLLQRVTFEL